jgi:uncharacterized protein (TIGR02145 family)
MILKFNSTFSAGMIQIMLVFFALATHGEGTKQVIPPGTAPPTWGQNGAYAKLALTTGTTYSTFANFNATADYRLYIHIASTTEKILFGFQKDGIQTIKFNIHEPVSPFTVVFSGTIPGGTGTGYIEDLNQAYAGPFPASGGYTPFEYVPTMTGDYFIEFYTTIGIPPFTTNTEVDALIRYFDITVLKSGYQTPPVPSDAQDGRVWSKSWQFNSVSISTGDNKHFAGTVQVLSDDGIVTKIDFNKMLGGTFMIFCNPEGVISDPDPTVARKSRPGNFKYPDYKVFLNNPDPVEYPSGTPGSISTNPAPTMTPAPPPCSGNENITFSVSQAGKVDITLDLPPPYTSKVFTQVPVVTGTNTILWDGLDGGTPAVPVADGTSLTMNINYLNGLTNLPLYDVEYTANTNYTDQGLKVTLVRPTTGVDVPRMYWDDLLINPSSTTCKGTLNDIIGCLPSLVVPTDGCHKWATCLGNVNTINTWWYAANSSSGIIVVTHNSAPPNPVGINNLRCGPGSLTINATVLNNEVADWYSDAAGTLLLQTGTAGNTSYTTPVLTATTTYYVKARNLTTNCISPGLTAVSAEIYNTPDAPTGLTNISLCGPQAVSLTATVGTGLTVEWWDAPTGGNSLGTNATYITPVLTVGTYTYYAEAVAAQPICARSPRTAFNVSITPVPFITLINPPSSVCSGSTAVINLSTTFSSTLPGTTYLWTVPPGNCTNILVCPPGGSGTLISDLLTLANPINFGQVIYDITPTVAGCAGTGVPLTVPVSPFPASAGPVLPVTAEVCQGQAILYSIAAVANATEYNWSVVPAGAASLITPDPVSHNLATITWDAAYTGAATIHVNGENSCGDGIEATQLLTIRPNPVVTARLCENIVTTTEGRPVRLKWGLPLGGEYSGAGVSLTDKVTFSPGNSGGAGVKTITYSYTNQYSCSAEATATIQVTVPPVFTQCGLSTIRDVRTNTVYTTFLVGSGVSARCWMAKNMDFGTMVADNLPQTDNCLSEKYCRQSDPAQCANNGALYQWDELMQYEDPIIGYQDLCLPGWHVPSATDWQMLIDAMQGPGQAGGYLKDLIPTGFGALLRGLLYLNTTWAFVPGETITGTIFWTSTLSGNKPAARGLNIMNPSVSLYESSKANAFPVRCVKD